jgi:hypothetical protein
MQKLLRPRSGLVVVRNLPKFEVSRIRTHPAMANSKGKVRGPQDRLYRDEVGEKLYRLWKQSVEVRRETGKESGPFVLKDWMR